MNKANDWLREKYAELKIANPSITLRRFAAKIKVSSGRLSELLSGKRAMTPMLLKRIIKNLDLRPSERIKIEAMFLNKIQLSSRLWPAETITEETFDRIADWYYFAINALLWVEGEVWTVNNLANRLGLDLATTKKAVANLRNLGLIEFREGVCVGLFQNLFFSGVKTSRGVKRFQTQILDKAKSSLDNANNKNAFGCIVFTANEIDMLKIKRKMASFRRNLCSQMLSDKPGAQVYVLNSHLFAIGQ